MSICLALLVSADPATIQQFSHALRQLSISPDICPEVPDAIRILKRKKFDAVIVDHQLGDQSGQILDAVLESASNRAAVTFAIGGSGGGATSEFRKRAGFFFERPLSMKSVCCTLKSAYGLILRERRRYFRCATSLPVVILRRSMPEVRCSSVNISEGGMALSTLVSLSPGEDIQIQFTLPGREIPLLAESKICWRKTGHLGVRFTSVSPENKSELQEWLSRKLEEKLPDFVAGKFQKVADHPGSRPEDRPREMGVDYRRPAVRFVPDTALD